MPFSHHSHSGQFCLHARNTLEEMVQRALELEYTTFALTEHMPRDDPEDLYPEEIEAGQTPGQLYDTFDSYYQEAKRMRQLYAPRITLLIGFECDWIGRPGYHSNSTIRALLAKYDFDFVVGSVHHVNAIPIDFDRATYERARQSAAAAAAATADGDGAGCGTDAELFGAYFDAQYDMLERLRPLVVGHFDLVRLHSDEPDGDLQRYGNVWAKVMRNLEFIAGYGGILEINSAALRKGMSEAYPGRQVCEAFLGLGGRFTLSDDSHAVEQVGLNYHKVVDFIQSIGLDTVHYLEPKQQVDSEHISPRAAVRSISVTALKESPFWKHVPSFGS